MLWGTYGPVKEMGCYGDKNQRKVGSVCCVWDDAATEGGTAVAGCTVPRAYMLRAAAGCSCWSLD